MGVRLYTHHLCICLLEIHCIWAVADLTLKAHLATAAEDIHKYFFSSPELKALGELIV